MSRITCSRLALFVRGQIDPCPGPPDLQGSAALGTSATPRAVSVCDGGHCRAASAGSGPRRFEDGEPASSAAAANTTSATTFVAGGNGVEASSLLLHRHEPRVALTKRACSMAAITKPPAKRVEDLEAPVCSTWRQTHDIVRGFWLGHADPTQVGEDIVGAGTRGGLRQISSWYLDYGSLRRVSGTPVRIQAEVGWVTQGAPIIQSHPQTYRSLEARLEWGNQCGRWWKRSKRSRVVVVFSPDPDEGGVELGAIGWEATSMQKYVCWDPGEVHDMCEGWDDERHCGPGVRRWAVHEAVGPQLVGE